ncbi:MAG TPA: polyprenyl synthetase family protein [Bacteroidales bacterium]|nr:polyprenyl synthetase family protein [Bacteroidales bacterium]
MPTLNEITLPISANLKEFNELFAKAMRSDSQLLDKVVNYILKTKGKQLRPILVFLSAGISGNINKSTYTAATLIEMLHTATLVHDDVVDESDMRRGFFSINALWKNKVAVLVGDYLLSRGLMTALEHQEFNLLQIVSDAVQNISEGELLQIKKSRTLNIDEETYLTVIRKKTASLIAACCAAGTSSTSSEPCAIERMKTFGENLGMAFQIKDDLLDFDQTSKTGKPAHNDLKDRKFSLPLIHTFKIVSFPEKRRLLGILKNHSNDKEKIEHLIQRIKEENGFEYAESRMNEYKNKALEILSEFPDSEYKKSLEELVIFTTERVY